MHRLIIQSHMRRVVAVAVALLLWAVSVTPTVAAATPDSGKVGGLSWSVSGGVLTIRGRGEMPDFSEPDMAPWYAHRQNIRRVDLDDRITSIGALAFYDCSGITEMALSTRVKTVGDMAFAGCSAMTTVSLPAVTALGRNAFSRCFSLGGVILPDTLTVMADAVFYRCESLRTIRVPASVTQMGGSVFAYCAALLQAEIAAPLEALPEWTFYGCERIKTVVLPASMSAAGNSAFTRCDVLTTVYYDGTEEDASHLAEDITEGHPTFSITQISPSPESLPVVGETQYENTGDTVEEITTEIRDTAGAVIETETVVTRPILGNDTLGDEQGMHINISAAIRGDDGWDALIKEFEQQAIHQGVFEREHQVTVPLTVQITLLESSVIRGETLRALAGQDVTLRLCTPNGSRWSIDCRQLQGRTFKNRYDLAYTVTRYENPRKAHQKVIGTAVSYWIDFADAVDFPATVEAYIDPTTARHTATLYEDVWARGLQKLQSVLLSGDGIAAYRMANVNKGKRYVVALDVSGITVEETIIPQDLSEEYGGIEDYVPITQQYVITDVRGFMGMTMKEFTIVLACGIGGLALVVGVVMLALSALSRKRAAEAAMRDSAQE